MQVSAKRRQMVFDWCDQPADERLSRLEFRRKLRMSYKTFELLREEWKEAKQKDAALITIAPDRVIARRRGLTEEDKWAKVEQSIYKEAINGKVKAQELYAKIKNKLSDKQEVNLRFDDDDLYRAFIGFERRQDTGSKGDEGVQGESQALLTESRLDSGLDSDEDS